MNTHNYGGGEMPDDTEQTTYNIDDCMEVRKQPIDYFALAVALARGQVKKEEVTHE